MANLGGLPLDLDLWGETLCPSTIQEAHKKSRRMATVKKGTKVVDESAGKKEGGLHHHSIVRLGGKDAGRLGKELAEFHRRGKLHGEW
jgi:hypothetical protein